MRCYVIALIVRAVCFLGHMNNNRWVFRLFGSLSQLLWWLNRLPNLSYFPTRPADTAVGGSRQGSANRLRTVFVSLWGPPIRSSRIDYYSPKLDIAFYSETSPLTPFCFTSIKFISQTKKLRWWYSTRCNRCIFCLIRRFMTEKSAPETILVWYLQRQANRDDFAKCSLSFKIAGNERTRKPFQLTARFSACYYPAYNSSAG